MKKFTLLFTLSVIFMFGLSSIVTAQNLALNPGFESWTVNGAAGPADNWDVSSTSLTGAQETTNVRTGTYSTNLTWTTTSTCQLEQYIAVTAGSNYSFSFWALDNDPNGRARVAIRWYDSGGDFISGYYGGYTIDDSNWQQLTSGSQTAPVGTVEAHVEIRVYDVSWSGVATVYVDDTEFVAITALQISNAYAISETAMDVLYSANVSSVSASDYSLTGTTAITFSGATIDGANLSLVHLTGASVNMASDITLDNIADAANSENFDFYAGIMSNAFVNTTNPGGTMADGEIATFKGIVSANDAYNNVWFSDAAGAYNGVLIYSGSFDALVAVGDEILFTAKRTVYSDLTELEYPVLISTISTGNTPYGPDVIDGSDIDESIAADTDPGEKWEGQLVKIEDFTVDSYVDYDYTCSWSDGATTYYFHVGDNVDYNFGAVTLNVGETYGSITGVVDWYSSDPYYYRINPREQADINPSSGGGTPTKLDITSINGGNNVYDAQPFSVTVQAQDVDGNPANVDANVNVSLSIGTGTGTLGGTLTGTIVAENNTVVISGVTYTPYENGVALNVSDDSNLTAGNSDAFDVLEVIIPDLVITEIMYHAMGGTDTLEYIELYNNGDVQIDMENLAFTQGVEYTFGSVTLDVGGYLLVAKNASAIMDAFGVSALEWTDGGLVNTGEDIEIKNAGGNVVTFVDYGISNPWPDDEKGKSIRFCDPSLDNNDPVNWSISVEFLATVEGEDMYGTPLEGCGNAPPVADFESDVTTVFVGQSVDFISLATNNPTLYSWGFEGGTPYISSDVNPTITYNTVGVFDVNLYVENSVGNDTEVKTDYIEVVNIPDSTLIITNPNGGEFILQGDAYDITWIYDSLTGNIDIKLVKEGDTPVLLGSNISVEDESWIWNVSPTQQLGDDFKIMIVPVDPDNPSDESDDYFSIIEPYIGSEIVITEIMYNPPESGNDSLEFIEIYNNGSETVNMEGFSFTAGVEFTFPNVDLLSDSYLLVGINSAAMLETFAVDAYQWTTGGALSNGGEKIELSDSYANVIDSLTYDDALPWDPLADGNGPSLTLCNPDVDNSIAENWTHSINLAAINTAGDSIWATPGFGCVAELLPSFEANVTSVIVGDSVLFTDLTIGDPIEWIWTFEGGTPETWNGQTPPYIIYNDEGMWDVTLYVSDGADSSEVIYTDYIEVVYIPDPTVTITNPNGGEFISQGDAYDITWIYDFWTGDIDIKLVKEGDTPVLLGSNISVEDGSWTWTVSSTQQIGDDYKIMIVPVNPDNPSDESDDYFSIIEPYIGAGIVITEIMYNPPESGTDSLEFIELYNNGDETLNLEGFHFTEGVVYIFPNFELAPNNFLLVASNSSAMMNTFGVDAMQWTSGGLSNSGEDIELRDSFDNIIDSLTYDDHLPWDTLAAGYGPSLTLCNPDLDNSVAENWTHSINYAAINNAGDSIWATPGFGCEDLLPDFDANVTSVIIGDYVVFTDLTIGDPIDWKWTFEGGTPEIYFGQTPTDIYYDEVGVWDVTLFVSDGITNAEITYSDYIEVIDLPAPTSLEAEVGPYDDVQLTWSAPSLIAQLQRGINAELLGYNIYRDGDQINPAIVDITEYYDAEPPIGSHNYYVTAVYDGGESGPSNLISIVVTDINEVAANLVDIYPNPTDGVFTIEYTGENTLDISIIDITGKEVYNNTLNKTSQTNISGLNRGLYFVRLYEAETKNIIVKKLIIR